MFVLTTSGVVWLTALQGGSVDECLRAAEAHVGRRMSRKYVCCLRHELNRAIRAYIG
jgi:hypothetical protein